jgi:hypothetical protein
MRRAALAASSPGDFMVLPLTGGWLHLVKTERPEDDFGLAGRRAPLRNSRHVLQPSGGTAASPMAQVVQRRSDFAQGVSYD